MSILILLGGLIGAPAYAQVSEADLDVQIELASLKYNVDPEVMRAIATIESSYGKRAILRRNKNATYDVGVFQINSVHWSTTCRGYDVTTLEGNTNCGARLLKAALKRGPMDRDAVGAYHSRTPSKKHKYATKVRAILGRNKLTQK